MNTVRKKILCIDGRPLNKKGDGISRYLLELLRELIQLNSFKIYIVSNREIFLEKDFPMKDLVLIEDKKWEVVPGTIWMQLKLPKIIKKLRADVFWGTCHILPLKKHVGIKYLLTIHDLVYKKHSETMTLHNKIFSALFMSRSISFADKILAVSETTKKDILYYYPKVNDSDVVVQYLGGIENFPIDDKATKKPHTIFILGSLEPRKNIEFFIHVFRKMVDINPSFNLFMTGANKWKDGDVLATIKNLGLSNNVHLLGYLTDAEINKLFNEVSLFVFPSKYEGFGLPLIEAQGKTRIALSKIPVFEELSQFFKNVEIFSCDDSFINIAQQLIDFECTSVKSCVKDDVRSKFTWESSSQILHDEIIKMCGANNENIIS